MSDFLLSLISSAIFIAICWLLITNDKFVNYLFKFSSSKEIEKPIRVLLKALGGAGIVFVAYSFISTWFFKH